VAAALAGALGLTGCAKMDAALGKQYIVVQFFPNTTLATARHVTAACSHIPNLRLRPVKPTTAQAGIVDSATYDATTATDANLARLQMCLARFRSVQGVTSLQPGD
jgi:hypothetical protein